MFKSKLVLDRRTWLRGAGGAAVALPWLEMMSPRSVQAAPAPRRFVVCFMGTSLGGDGDPIPNMFVPDQTGPGYDVKLALKPISVANLTGQVSVISGLRVPSGGAGGYSGFHAGAMATMLTGTSNGGGSAAQGTTSDELVADAPGFKGATKFRSLRLRVQASGYAAGPSSVRDSLSYRESGKIGMQSSPKDAYESLFFDLKPPATDPGAVALRDYQMRTRRSVLDLVRGNTETLIRRLGRYDAVRFERHRDEIRDLERRLGTVGTVGTGSAAGAGCGAPPSPGSDPPVAGNIGKGAGAKPIITETNAWSDEERRALVMTDILHMSLACDLTRVGTLMYTMAQCFLNMYPVLGYKSDVHQISHFGAGSPTTQKVSEVIGWHVKHWARLIKKLSETPEGGGTLLDSCAVVLLPEGGGGGTSHTGENMACLVAGRAGGLKAGQHLAFAKKHISQVLIALMNAVGVPTTNFGSVSGDLPEMRA